MLHPDLKPMPGCVNCRKQAMRATVTEDQRKDALAMIDARADLTPEQRKAMRTYANSLVSSDKPCVGKCAQSLETGF